MNWRKLFSYPILYKLQGNKELVYLKELNKSQYFTKKELEKLRLKKLQALVSHAYKNVPYYKNLFNLNFINPKEINSLEYLTKIPVLDKKTIQENFESLIANNYDKNSLIYDYSGGSTGVPTKFLYTKDNASLRLAALKRHDLWAGFDYGEKLAIVWGARRDFKVKKTIKQKLWSFLTVNNLVFDSSAITKNDIEVFIKEFNKFKPKTIQAYPQSLEIIAKFIAENNIVVHSPYSIITSAELLTQENRKLIEKVFDSKIYDRYGAREVSVIASECEFNTMHVRDEDIIVEIVDEYFNPCKYGEEGEILVTDLTNLAFPLIRFRIGDVGVPIENKCRCGRSLSTIKMSSGRTSSFIITPENRKISGAAITAYVCTAIDGLHRVQFYQNNKKKVLVKVIPNNKFTKDTVIEFDKRIRDFMDNIEPEIQIVESIEVPKSGKHQFVINELLKTK